MFRNVLGGLLALIGAAVAVISPFRTWYDGRAGRDIRVQELFTSSGLSSTSAGLFTGLFLPMLAVAVVTVVGVVLRSRLLVALAGVLVLGFTVLWMIRQYQIADRLVIGDNGMDTGALAALASGVVLLLAATVMSGRQPSLRAAHVPATDTPEATTDDRVVNGPWDTGTSGTWDDAERHRHRRDAA